MLAELRPVVAFRPGSQAARRPQRAPASQNAGSGQYKNVLAVAVSQEQRLCQNGAVRRGTGYDMSDPFLAGTSEADFAGKKFRKALELADVDLPGRPCQVVGTGGAVCTFLGMTDGKSKKECSVRWPNGNVTTVQRSRLLPLPTLPPKQCDWAIAVGLTGELARYNGYRCLCGESTAQEQAFWVLFEKLAAPTETKPPVEMISLENLVALASTPQDLFETEFEAKLRALPNLGQLPDDSGRLALKDEEDKEEDTDGESSEALTDEEVESLEVGDVVTLLPDDKQLGIVKSLEEKTAEVMLLPSSAPSLAARARTDTYPRAMLTKTSLPDAEKEAVCDHCGKAKPEDELLICENFCKSCASTIHIGCLDPPLDKVPADDWYCPICLPGKKRKAKAKAEPKSKQIVKAKAQPKGKAKAKASISKRGKS